MTNEEIEKAKNWCEHFNCYENNGFRKGHCTLDGYENCKEIIALYDRLKAEQDEVRKQTAKEIIHAVSTHIAKSFSLSKSVQEYIESYLKLLKAKYEVDEWPTK